MSVNEYNKLCPECAEHFDARRLNQKFCSDTCKIRFNNRNMRASYHTRKRDDIICGEMNSILFKNRKILKQFEGKTVKLEELKLQGFKLKYITLFDQKADKMSFYCYDVGYEFLDNNTLTVFKR